MQRRWWPSVFVVLAVVLLLAGLGTAEEPRQGGTLRVALRAAVQVAQRRPLARSGGLAGP